MKNSDSITINTYCIYDGKIITGKKLNDIRNDFPDAIAMENAYSIAEAKTNNGCTTNIYAFHLSNEIDIDFNAEKILYEFHSSDSH